MNSYWIDITAISIIAASLGIFYRNCLKGEGMIFNFIYRHLQWWAERPLCSQCHGGPKSDCECKQCECNPDKPTWFTTEIDIWRAGNHSNLNLWHCITSRTAVWYRFLKFISFPLGYCLYCATTWIAIFITLGYFYFLECSIEPYLIILGLLATISISHVLVTAACRWLINLHPDFDHCNWKKKNSNWYNHE
jgi:hypothetical protein